MISDQIAHYSVQLPLLKLAKLKNKCFQITLYCSACFVQTFSQTLRIHYKRLKDQHRKPFHLSFNIRQTFRKWFSFFNPLSSFSQLSHDSPTLYNTIQCYLLSDVIACNSNKLPSYKNTTLAYFLLCHVLSL